MEIESIDLLVIGGLFFGLILGVIFQYSKFCMAAIVSNFVLMRDYRQLHAYLAALIVAIIGTQFLSYGGIVNLENSSYLSSNIDWLGAVIGGLFFGVGSIFAGGCIGRSTVRFGEGNIGAIIVLIAIGIAGSVTLYGALEPVRLWIAESSFIAVASNNSSIPSVFGISNGLFLFFFALFSLLIIFYSGRSNRSLILLSAGISIGLVIVAAWWFTGSFTQDDFSSVHNPASVTYAGPITNTAFIVATGSTLGDSAYFGISLFIGTIIGSFISAMKTHSFHWILPELHHVKHLIIGGLFMGFGAILAGGCNIGQGLTGISTLSVKSLISIVAIVCGMRLGLLLLSRFENHGENKLVKHEYGLLKFKSIISGLRKI